MCLIALYMKSILMFLLAIYSHISCVDAFARHKQWPISYTSAIYTCTHIRTLTFQPNCDWSIQICLGFGCLTYNNLLLAAVHVYCSLSLLLVMFFFSYSQLNSSQMRELVWVTVQNAFCKRHNGLFVGFRAFFCGCQTPSGIPKCQYLEFAL